MSQYSGKIIILRAGVLKILINTWTILSQIVNNKHEETVIKTAAKTIREDIDFCNAPPETSWPPMTDKMQSNMCPP